jgi:hypothetical protein
MSTHNGSVDKTLPTINPIKATMIALENKNYDINNINQVCFSVCQAYGDVYGNDVREKCKDQCTSMISQKKQEYGFSDCSKKRPAIPADQFRVPHFFPELLSVTSDRKGSLNTCLTKCDTTSYPAECRGFCHVDYNALECEKVTPTPASAPLATPKGANKGVGRSTRDIIIIVVISVVVFLSIIAYVLLRG